MATVGLAAAVIAMTVLVERMMQAGGDFEVFGVVDTDEAMPQREIEDHQVDIELEVVGLADRLHHMGDRPKFERRHLAVDCTGTEILGQFEIVAVQTVASQPLVGG